MLLYAKLCHKYVIEKNISSHVLSSRLKVNFLPHSYPFFPYIFSLYNRDAYNICQDMLQMRRFKGMPMGLCIWYA